MGKQYNQNNHFYQNDTNYTMQNNYYYQNNMNILNNFNIMETEGTYSRYSETEKQQKQRTNGKKVNIMIVDGYIRECYGYRLNINQNVSDIINCYLSTMDDNKLFDEDCFDELLDRVNLLDDRLEMMQNNIHEITTNINDLLYDAEQRRIYEMNTMQKQFNGQLQELYQRINNKLQSITNTLQQNQQNESMRIQMLEKKIYSLNLEKNKQNDDISKLQQTIKNINGFNLYLNENEKDKHNEFFLWLTEIVRLRIYYDLLIKNGYDDMESIRDITEDDLIHIGVKKLGHRKKIIKYAHQHNYGGTNHYSLCGHLQHDSPTLTIHNTVESV